MSNRRRLRRPRRLTASITLVHVNGSQTFLGLLDPLHVGCLVCTPYVIQRQADHAANVAAIHSASLRASGSPTVDAPEKKQETSRLAGPEVSTPATSSAHDGRAASAQCATSGRS